MQEFKVNEYITLKLEDNKTNIYVGGELFRQCKLLLIDIPIEKISYSDGIESIDEAEKRLDKSTKLKYREVKIPPEAEFWGHCSNMQVWAENNYNTYLLHSNLAFPLLKILSEIGDPLAKNVFKEELISRLKSNFRPIRVFLIYEGYLDLFSIKEIEKILDKELEETVLHYILKEELKYRVSEVDKDFANAILSKLKDNWQRIPHLIFKLRIRDEFTARKLEIILNKMAKKKIIQSRIRNGKKWWKLK